MAFRRIPSAGSDRSPSGGRPGRGEVSPRALEAMAHAVSRSRNGAEPRAESGRRPNADRDERRLRTSVLLTGAAVLVAGVALAAAVASGSGGGADSSTTLPAVHTPTGGTPNATTAPAHPTGSGGAGHTTTTKVPTAGARPVTTTTPPPAHPGGGPAIVSLSPVTGGPGTPLTVTGSGFLSADGTIVAEVDGRAAPTSCADQTTCTVTVPSLPGASGSVPVTVSTAAGTSAPASFTYGGEIGTGSSSTPPTAVVAPGGPSGQNQTTPPGGLPGGADQRGGSRDRPGKFP